MLAGILIKVGWDIIDWPLLAHLHRIRRDHLFVLVLTLGLTVFVDLVTAVAIGLIVAGMAHARQIESLELDNVLSVPLLDRVFFEGVEDAATMDDYSARVGLVALRGAFTVASSHKLVNVIGKDIKDHEIVIFDFSDATYLDDSAAMLIRQLLDVAGKSRTHVIVMAVSGTVEKTLHTLDILAGLPGDHVVETMDQAREVALELLKG